MKIHVCLVSDQTLANLIPALMERPDRIVLVATAEMKRRNQDIHLREILATHGLAAESVEDAPDVSLVRIRRYAEALAQALREAHGKAGITLNATGGTKLMMLGFVEVFQRDGARIIYTDTAHRRIEEIGRDTVTPMQNALDVPAYLAAQHMKFDRADSDDPSARAAVEQRASLTRFIGECAPRLQAGIKILNGIVAGALKRNSSTNQDELADPRFTLRNGAWGDFARLLGRADKLGLIEWQDGAAEGRIADLESARYLNGGWLEEYAYLCLGACRPFDVRMGVHRAGADAELNEFDVLVAHFNQLLFVECKTANYLNQIGQANQVAYKVDSLGRQARGFFGETWLLSAISPPAELIDRARDAGIRVIGPDEIPRLDSLVAEWVKGKSI